MCENEKGVHFEMDKEKVRAMKVACAKKGLLQKEFIEEAISEKLEKMEE